MALSTLVVHRELRAAASRLRWARAARFLLGAGALAAIFLGLFLSLDAWLHLGSAGRWTGFALIVGAAGLGTVLGARAWRSRLSEESVARRIEESGSSGGNVLISAVQFDRQLADNAPLKSALFSEMSDPFPKVSWDRVFDARLLKRLGLTLGVALLAIAGWAVARPAIFVNSAARVLLPGSNIAPLTRTKIEHLLPGDETVVHGRTASVRMSLGGEVPKSAWINFRQEGSNWQRALMAREAGRPDFEFAFKEVKQSIEYFVEAGDAQSQRYQLRVRPRTAIKARTAEIESPAYTGLAPQTVAEFNVLQNVVPGSSVRFVLDFNNDLAELTAANDQGPPAEVSRVSATRWTVRTTAASNRTIRLNYRDTLEASDSATLQLAVKPDEAPRIVVSEPVEGQQLTATKGSKMAMKFSVTDAFGLGDVALYQGSNDKEDAQLVQRWDGAKGLKQFESAALVTVAPFEGEDRVTFRIRATDTNNVTGPGVSFSRPIVVALNTREKLEKLVDEAAVKLSKGLEMLIKLQQENLDATKMASIRKEPGPLTALTDRQARVAESARQLMAAAHLISPDVRDELRSLSQREMQDAIIALRNAGAAAEAARAKFLGGAAAIETIILARLQGAPAMAENDARRDQIGDLISGVEDLLKRQRELHRETKTAPAENAPALAPKQDALAEKATQVRQSIDKDSRNASIGDADFRQRLAKVGAMFGEFRVYEDMLATAEQLEAKKPGPAAGIELRVIGNLAKMVELLNQWQLAEAERQAGDLKKEAEEMKQKLEKLAEIQKEMVEKTRDMARKDEWRPEDIATSQEMKDQHDLMKEAIEQMVTDMHAFPDMKPGNEMKAELVQIIEDVQQADKQEVAGGKLKPQEIAVQKEQGLLDAIEQAKELAADMEMWLPNKNETQKWLLENFDKNEMPEIPNVPLADAFEDLVGDLLESQENMQQDIQDAASNQAMAMNPANGWEIRDGPMPGFGAQGKSGNEKPNHNEQMGRSSGGREGMSDGEMAGDTANNLKGDKPDVRRTKDPLQQGQVKDDGGIGETRATGGGKAGGFSDRQGMEGNAPLRAVKAPKTEAANALAVQQALLQEKTAKTVAQASLLYLRSDPLAQVARLMSENEQAIREGRVRDAQGLHQRIVGRLREIKEGIAGGQVVALSTGDSARAQDKQLLGGSEGEAPTPYKDMVADYFRSLVEEK